jgi:hypothetical protein
MILGHQLVRTEVETPKIKLECMLMQMGIYMATLKHKYEQNTN